MEYGSRAYWSQVEDKMEEEQEMLLDKEHNLPFCEDPETTAEGAEWWNRDAESLS